MAGLKEPHTSWVLPLNDKYYTLDEDEKAFFKKETRIEDDDELKKHIIAVQTKAFPVCLYPYWCKEHTLIRVGKRFINILAFASSSSRGRLGTTTYADSLTVILQAEVGAPARVQ